MAEGLQAGRLDVPVVADLAGFAAKLRSEVEAAAEGLAAKIKVEVNAKGLRKQLKKAVEEASKGVTAKVKVKVDEERFRSELDGIRRSIDDLDLNLPVRPDRDGDNGGRRGGLLSGLRNLITGAQDEADRRPVNVPIRAKMPRGRGLLIGGLLSLLEPAVALIGQYGAGLTALVSAAAPAVGVLGAIPGLIAAAGTAAIGTKIAFSGFGDALKETLKIQQQHAAGTKVTKAEQQKLDQALGKLSKSARETVTEVSSLSGAWSKVRKSISERFFSKISGDIKPLAKSVLPLLKDALGDSASQMGSLADRAAKAMKSGVFRKDFKTIAGTNSRVVGSLVDGLANMGHATTDFLVASGPFVERVAQGGKRLTQWFRASVQAGRETGSLAKFLDHAGDKAAQLGRTTGSLIRGFGGVGRAAMDTGNAMLDGLEGSMKRFERYANSGAGQKAMKQFFSDAAPAFHEVNLLFGDLMRGLGRSMKDGGITDLVRQIRLELMPALGTFFSSLGQTVGPALISVISNIATAIGNLSAAGSGLGVLLVTFNGLLQIFNGIMGVIPGANTGLAIFLGTMLALKVVSGVATMLRGFGTSVVAAGTSVRTLNTTLRGTATASGTSLSLWGRMSGVYSRVSQQGGRLTGTLRGIGAANKVAVRALGGITGALGGPLGIAITAATIGLGWLASKQEAAARAAEAHEEQVENLAQALAQSNGEVDANVRAQAAAYLYDVKLADGKGKLVDVLRDAGVSLKDVTNAYLDQGGSVDDLQKKLTSLADATKYYKSYAADKASELVYTEQGEKYKAAADALGDMNGTLKETRKRQQELADATNGSTATGTTAYDRLQTAVQGFADKTKSADERTDALKRALDALSGNTQSFHDAEAQLNNVMLQIDDTMKSNIDHADGWGKALVGNDHLVDTSTKNGQTLNSQLTELRDNMLAVATKAQEAGEQGLMPMSDAMDKGQAAMEKARKKALELARDMGIPKDQAKALVDQMGFVPDTITTLVTAKGIPEATAEVLALRGKLESIPPGKGIQINAPTVAAREQLEALGFTVQRIPGSKKVTVSAPTGGARVNIAALAQDIANAPDKKKVTVQAIIQKAAGDLKNVQQKVAGLPKGKSIDVKAPTAVAQKALKDLGFKIQNVDGKGGKTVRITAPTKSPLANVQRIQGAINGLTGKTVHVTVQYSESGKPSVVRTHADGGIVRYANGGIRAAMDRVRAFAAGAENHIAQIGKPGEWRLWAEPETGGEAYIPLAPGKRKRSEAILEKVAEMFGGRVVYFANGAMRQYAQGGVRTRATTVRQRTAAAQAAGSLVGGDLNLNIGAVASTGTALEDAMFELRRIRLGGGGNA
ncbi:hypothetical protein ABZT04_33700 [Streptomyces sp. NPDC005492]|uniref:hypothetical protein n=1 Tax=Streptomyces sp. NPDC005492 TaxID=3156883 RepID=UPI0033B0D100